MHISSFGLSPRQLQRHAHLHDQGIDIPWKLIHRAFKAISSYGLGPNESAYLKARLLDIEQPSLWQIASPTVVINRFPNNELRFFLVSQDSHLFEHQSASIWFRFFPFIHTDPQGALILDIEENSIQEVDLDLAWLPQNPNYSHFLCDFFAPWLAFDIQHYRQKHDLSVLQLQPFPSWQQPLLDQLGFPIHRLSLNQKSPLTILKLRSVFFPIIPSVLLAQYFLRAWLMQVFAQEYHQALDLEPVPLALLGRSDYKQQRIRNYQEIKDYVLKSRGIVIDPSKLSIPEKILTLGSAQQIICEGSGSMNSVLFASDKSRTILLQDPSAFSDPLMLEGGYPYLHGIAHRTLHCQGINSTPILGSPLGSCTFPIAEIDSLLKRHVIEEDKESNA